LRTSRILQAVRSIAATFIIRLIKFLCRPKPRGNHQCSATQ
jgi:hypothetical protein